MQDGTTCGLLALGNDAVDKPNTGMGWTQEDIAAEVGMSQAYVSRMLTFGRFSKFMPKGINCELLTERAFREHWGKTDPTVADERLRFQAVERALGWPVTPIPAPPPPISARP